MKTILFTAADDGAPVGTASWTEHGLVYENDKVKAGMRAVVNRAGEEKAFNWYAKGWSNGHIVSELVED